MTKVENQDASSYATFRLKNRLKERFPQLVFYTPKVRNKNEIVYVEDLSRESVVETLIAKENDSQSDSSDNEEEVEDERKRTEHTKKTVELKDLYMVALALRQNIREYCSSWYENWPPLASDITGKSVTKVVSPLLFNFLAWVLGHSEEPQDSGYVGIDENYAVKVFSLCQDLVFNCSKGRTQTPKSLALAIAVRQISGCSELIRILNGFGHCVSLSSTMAFDSAIAQLVLETSDIIPREFVEGGAINLVYDNIDFGEEVTKQTHVTNGIITQKVPNINQITPERKAVKIPKSQRTVEVPDRNIVPYSLGAKKSPRFDIEVEQLTGNILIKTAASEKAQRLDFTYVVMKMVILDGLNILPGWTGNNNNDDHYDGGGGGDEFPCII